MHRIFLAAALTVAGTVLSIPDAIPTEAAVLSTGAPNGSFGGYICADVRSGDIASGTPVQAYDCNAAPNQQFELAGITIYALGAQRCLDVLYGGTAAGTKVDSATCNGTGAQQWYYYRGQLVNINSGKCLDAGNSVNLTQLVINSCNNSNSQQWQIK
jgi:hypothetical protein